jgi:hypothetical protein
MRSYFPIIASGSAAMDAFPAALLTTADEVIEN